MGRNNNLQCARALAAVLLVSFLLRLFLVLCGGQYFFPDEQRYERARTAASYLWSGEPKECLRSLHRADHFFFRVLGVAPATAELVAGNDERIPAIFFSLSSIVSIWLMWGITLRLGGSRLAALLSSVLLALSATCLCYSRHILPYDTAMALSLAALYAGLRTPSRFGDSIMCGLCAGLAFLTYNGYWTIAGFALVVHVLHSVRDIREAAERALVSGLALVTPMVVLLSVSALGGRNMYAQFVAFSGWIKQGEFFEGWSLPFSYLWYAEHALLVLWLIALLYALVRLIRGERARVLVVGAGGVIFVYAALVVFSVVFHRFVVYGRLARQMVPFLVLLTALALSRMRNHVRNGRILFSLLLAAICIQAAFNFRIPVRQVFPEEFRVMANDVMADDPERDYVIAYDEFLNPNFVPSNFLGEIVLHRNHPLEYLPFQYEGYKPDQRQQLRANDIRMRLILIQQ